MTTFPELPATDTWANRARIPGVRRIWVDARREGGRNPGAAPVAGDVPVRGFPPGLVPWVMP